MTLELLFRLSTTGRDDIEQAYSHARANKVDEIAKAIAPSLIPGANARDLAEDFMRACESNGSMDGNAVMIHLSGRCTRDGNPRLFKI